MNYYISDTHFYHHNIIKYDNRPFNTVTKMNDVLIKNWRDRVKEDDTVYILGDVSWADDTRDRETELIRVELQRKVREIRKYSEGLIKI